MTAHAKERWSERLAEPAPSNAEASRLIEESIQVQRHLEVYTPRGRKMTVPGLFWHPDRDLVLVVHDKQRLVMTVITRDMPAGPRRRQEGRTG